MLIKLIKKILSHELIGGAGIIFASSLVANLFNFFFSLFMSRNLSVSEFGILASLISLLTLSSQPIGAALPTLVYFSASYFAKNDLERVRGLFLKVTKPATIVGTLVFIAYILFSSQIAKFLHISDISLIFIVAFMIYLGFIGIANHPLLQAKLAFTFMSFAMILGTFLKLVFGILFVFLGFSVGGAMWAFLLGSLAPYFLSFIPLRFLLEKGVKTPHISFKSLFGYGTPAALASLGINSFINTDIILVKHLFSPDMAGLYATLSLIGKVIFFFSAPIGAVMFPLVTQKHARNEDFHSVFKLSLLLVFLSSLAITIFYFLFPEFTVRIFRKDPAALTLVPYVGIFGVFIIVYSLLIILNNFYLSINKTKVFIPILLAAFLQAVLIWFYHESFMQIIGISLATASLLLILLLLYYWHLYGKKAS